MKNFPRPALSVIYTMLKFGLASYLLKHTGQVQKSILLIRETSYLEWCEFFVNSFKTNKTANVNNKYISTNVHK